MTEASSLKDHFLIAMPSLQDPNFSRTVTYICEHGDHGAMGIVINRRSELTLLDLLTHMDMEPEHPGAGIRLPVYLGGPVETERGFVLHDQAAQWESSVEIADAVNITTSRDILDALAENQGPEHSLIALGYAGWGAGQLEQEMQDNSWLSGPADSQILFDLPVEKRWEAAARKLGVDLNLLSSEAGHA